METVNNSETCLPGCVSRGQGMVFSWLLKSWLRKVFQAKCFCRNVFSLRIQKVLLLYSSLYVCQVKTAVIPFHTRLIGGFGLLFITLHPTVHIPKSAWLVSFASNHGHGLHTMGLQVRVLFRTLLPHPELADAMARYEVSVNYTAVMPDVPEIEEFGEPKASTEPFLNKCASAISILSTYVHPLGARRRWQPFHYGSKGHLSDTWNVDAEDILPIFGNQQFHSFHCLKFKLAREEVGALGLMKKRKKRKRRKAKAMRTRTCRAAPWCVWWCIGSW